MTLLLYSHIITPRLQYVAEFIGSELSAEPFQLTTDKELFRNFPGAKINYSSEKICSEEFWLKPHSLLSETGIKQQSIECFETNGQKAFFKTDGDFPFDIFAASFYLLSRYEEYLPHQKDKYGRYAHENSLAFKESFLNVPLINIWLKDFRDSLQKKVPNIQILESNFHFMPTYDIDEAYSYKHKQWWRSAGASVKNILQGEWNKINERKKVRTGEKQDPFDAYEWINSLHRQYKLTPRYFFLVPRKTSKYDRNISSKEIALQKIIRQHADKYDIGVHPSWQSGNKPELLSKEIATIENISGKKITSSRQHFIRVTLPQTYRHLIAAGIQKDFSMGYGSINGFRASVASPVYWYDLEKEQITGLLLYPFCYMDANSFFEQKCSPQQALDEMRHYYNVVKKVNGTFISIWHNTFLGTDKMYAGWREAYEHFIKEVC